MPDRCYWSPKENYRKKYIRGLRCRYNWHTERKGDEGEILHVKKTLFLKSKNPQVLAKMPAGRSSQTLPSVSSSIKA